MKTMARLFATFLSGWWISEVFITKSYSNFSGYLTLGLLLLISISLMIDEAKSQ